MKKLYMDFAATTPVDQKVVDAMLPYFTEHYGNPSSVHSFGQKAKQAIDTARKIIANSINAEPSEIIFTSGGAESNNMAVKCVFWAAKKGVLPKKKLHIITTKIEHDSELNVCKWLEKQGCEVTYLPVDKQGFINISKLKDAIKKETILVSIVHGNNEIGTIQDMAAIGKICKAKKVYLHTDACQTYTKMPIDVKAMNIDLMTINASKIYGPKGIAVLYVNKKVKMETWLHGGGQESGRRSGTENVPGIVGFAEAVKLDPKIKHLETLQKYMKDQIMQIKNVVFNGPELGDKRLPDNLNFSFRYIEGEALLLLLDEVGIAVSTGSACSSHTLDTSHVLKAIGAKAVDANGTIRISLGRHMTKADVDYASQEIKKAVARLRSISPFGK